MIQSAQMLSVQMWFDCVQVSFMVTIKIFKISISGKTRKNYWLYCVVEYWLLIFCVGRHSCKVNCHAFLISNYPCIVTRGDDSNITRTKFFLCAIVHNNFHSSSDHILCVWCFTTICFRYRLYTFLPTPSRLELGSSYRNFTKSCNIYFALFKCSCFIWQ